MTKEQEYQKALKLISEAQLPMLCGVAEACRGFYDLRNLAIKVLKETDTNFDDIPV